MRICVLLIMHFRAPAILLYSLICLISCRAQVPERGILHDPVQVTSDTTLSYALYIPPAITQLQEAGVILFFDPQGSGRYPLELYRPLADKYGLVLIGNNNSRNGISLDLILANTQRLVDDLQERFGIPPQHVALWGFSGGAKAAMYAGSRLSVSGPVLYGGAYLAVDIDKKQLGFAGTADMNYADLIGYGLSQQHNPDHLQLEFEGAHTWPDSATADYAFAWLHLYYHPDDTELQKSYLTDIQIDYKNALKAKQYILARSMLDRCLFLFRGHGDISAWMKSRDSLLQTPGYTQEMAQRMAIQQQEQQLKSFYSQQFFSRPLSWWQTEISKLNASGNPMNKRMVAYFALAAYSLAHKALQLHDDNAAAQILGIYQLADPTNPEQAFLRAILYARQQEKGLSQAALDEARKLGFRDTARFQQDPDLKKLGVE